MIFPDIDPNDIINPKLRKLGLEAQENGEGCAVWHGRDLFTGEDVEIYINLDAKTGGMALGTQVFSAKVGEKGHLIVLHMDNAARGLVDFDYRKEQLPMNLERTGIEVFNDGARAHLRLFDKLTGQDILTLNDDEFHALVDEGSLDPKSYHASAFKHCQQLGLL